jgi:hypothetical protein
MIFLKIFFGVLLVRKNHQQRKIIDEEIPLLAGKILVTFTGFLLLLLDSGQFGRNPMAMARFQPVSLESGLIGIRRSYTKIWRPSAVDSSYQ